MTNVTETPGSNAQRERRRRILDATIALAEEGGFDAVQMRAVADDADVALGTLYRYFPSKIHLLVTALGRQFERAEEQSRTRQVPGDTPHENREPTDEDTAIVRVISDVWFTALMGWVTGRTTAADVTKSVDVAVRLLLR